MSKIVLFFFITLSLSSISTSAQKVPELVQFSGIIVSADDLKPIPFAHIFIKKSSRGTISDFNGFYSFVARPNDTIVFTSIGYKSGLYVIPDTLTKTHYTMFQVMQTDTVFLSEAIIYPWPSPYQFKNAFLNLRVPDDDYDRALKNIAFMINKDNFLSLPMDGSDNFKNMIGMHRQNLYTIGQMPVNNLLNPFAWAAFIRAWQQGDFRRKDYNIYDVFPPD